MTVQGVVEDSAPMKHSVRVEWFRHDPGGGTIFVKPADISDAAEHQATGHTDKADAGT